MILHDAVQTAGAYLPEGGGSSRGNGDTTLLLLLHPVHGGGTVMYLTNLVRHPV